MSPAKQYFSGTGKKSTTRKSGVAQTCNQLSLFLKEKGCLRDLHFGFNAKFDDSGIDFVSFRFEQFVLILFKG